MRIWRTVLLSLLVASSISAEAVSHSRIASTPGNVRLSGEIVESACYVAPGDQSLLVEFNDISARDVSNHTGQVSVHPFSIHLLGCSLGDSAHHDAIFHRATILFYDAAKHEDSTLLSVHSQDNREEDLAIEIFDRNGKPIELGEPSPDYVLNAGKNTLRFTAWLISPHGHVTSGDFNAAVHFVVNYL